MRNIIKKIKMIYIKVKVQAGAKKEIFREIKENYFEIGVKEKAERNMANKRVLEMFADFFGLSKGKVRIINGHQSPNKLLVIDKNV